MKVVFAHTNFQNNFIHLSNNKHLNFLLKFRTLNCRLLKHIHKHTLTYKTSLFLRIHMWYKYWNQWNVKYISSVFDFIQCLEYPNLFSISLASTSFQKSLNRILLTEKSHHLKWDVIIDHHHTECAFLCYSRNETIRI